MCVRGLGSWEGAPVLGPGAQTRPVGVRWPAGGSCVKRESSDLSNACYAPPPPAQVPEPLFKADSSCGLNDRPRRVSFILLTASLK